MPSISGLSPGGGSPLGGTLVTIAGSGFTGALNVLFGTTAAACTVLSDTSLTTNSPAGAAGSTVGVVVVTPGGASYDGTSTFSYGL